MRGGIEDLEATAVLLNRPLRPWQRQVAEVALARGERWRYPFVVFSVPRQSGKTTFLAVVAVNRCLSTRGARVWYTAQSRLDAVLRFSDTAALLRASSLSGWWHTKPPTPVDVDWDYRVTVGAGNEAITFPNGSSIRVFAPREDSLHGSVTDLVLIDEARFFDQNLGTRLLAAALPTQMTRDGQVWITSTAGGPGSTFLAEQMERGQASIAEADSGVCYGEWSLPETPADEVLVDRVWAGHPAAGLAGGPSFDAVRLAAQTMPGWQFAQEYGNVWRAEANEGMIPAAWWRRSESFDGPVGPVSFGFDVAPDRSASAVVACGDRRLEVVRADSGVGWLEGELRRLVDRWGPPAVVADASGPAAATVEALADFGERLVVVKSRELVAACNGLFDALEASEPKMWHRPHPLLDEAAATVTKRALSGSWVFGRGGGGHLLVAAALAWWADRRAPSVVEDWFVA